MKKIWVAGLIILLFVSLCTGSYVSGDTPPATLDLTIPDYEVTASANVDYVAIPGGLMLTIEEGRPKVPYYSTLVDYPKGYRVQDVVLKDRAGLMTTTGLRLPVVILSDNLTQPVVMKNGWYPEESFAWKLWENEDSSTTLVIQVFPFYYEPETTDVKFYKNYSFSIEYILSNVAITSIYPDKDIYAPGDTVKIDISLNNSGDEQDVVVSTVIKEYASETTIAGLPLKSIKGLSGEASLTEEWNSSGTGEGNYYAEVTLSDTTGNILDKKTAGISLGVPSSTTPEETTPTEQAATTTQFPTLYVVLGAVIVVLIIIIVVVLTRPKKKV